MVRGLYGGDKNGVRLMALILTAPVSLREYFPLEETVMESAFTSPCSWQFSPSGRTSRKARSSFSSIRRTTPWPLRRQPFLPAHEKWTTSRRSGSAPVIRLKSRLPCSSRSPMPKHCKRVRTSFRSLRGTMRLSTGWSSDPGRR